MKKDRLDSLLAEKGIFPSRERAKTAIMAGIVIVNGERIDKAGTKVDIDADIKVIGNDLRYVSRGGLKLEKAIEEFGLGLRGLTVLDIGASTGGFTDCSLQHGAVKVYAVDVGYGQLDWKLRQDQRVIVLERTNARYLTSAHIPEQVDLITIDASFISLDKIIPVVKQFLREEGNILALIKPQFEAGREKVGKKGVVRDPKTHQEVILHVIREAEKNLLHCWDLTYSPITGPEGNIEYLILLKLFPPEQEFEFSCVEKTVAEAFITLKRK
ncbi:MAG: TlyA family RNA methyltransferase [Bacillota bacterium]|jgi:23S rRNA (cytidine1920-2'-O)/16S rRNA (cytidine1409-2'-O)-methyltransferase